MELDSWQLKGFGESKISPQISVFTNFMPDHLNYYRGDMDHYFEDKANIFRFQNKEDLLFISSQAQSEIKTRFKSKIKSKIILIETNFLKNWKNNLIGEHNQINLALAIKVAESLNIPLTDIQKSVAKIKNESGRLELVGKINNIRFYNDTNATIPQAVIEALKIFETQKIILIAGGNDKELDYQDLAKMIEQKVKYAVFIQGVATDKILKYLPKNFSSKVVDNMSEAVKMAFKKAQKNDVILLSPGATSFGVFKNEYDRGEQFIKEVKKLIHCHPVPQHGIQI